MWKTGDPRVLKKRLKDFLPNWRIRGTHEAYVGFVSNHRAKFKWVATAVLKCGAIGEWAAITMLTSAERSAYAEQTTQACCATLRSCDDNTIFPSPLMHMVTSRIRCLAIVICFLRHLCKNKSSNRTLHRCCKSYSHTHTATLWCFRRC